MPTLPPQFQRIALLSATRRMVFLGNFRPTAKQHPDVNVSPAVVSDIWHWMANEHEYGVAKPLTMDAYRKEEYDAKLHPWLEPPSFWYIKEDTPEDQ